MFNTVTTGLFVAPLAIAHFRWGWDSNPWVPLMLHCLFPPHKQSLPMFILRPKKTPDSLIGFITSANGSKTFYRNTILSTRNTMINTGYRTNFRLETKYGYVCRRSISRGPIGSSTHFDMGLTLSARLWVEILLSSTLYPSLACTQCSMWTSFGHIFYHYWIH
jgi:hypothetical protein